MSRKICYPYILNPTGGSLVSTKLLAATVDEKFTPLFVFGEEKSAVEKMNKNGFQTVTLPLGDSLSKQIRGNNTALTEALIGVHLLPYIWKIRNLLKRESIDLVHTNDGLTTMIWGSAAKTLNIPVIWHVRSERANSWDRMRLRVCDRLIFVAKSNKRRFSHDQLSQVCSSVVYNGVDLSEFSEEDETYLHDELNISTSAPIVGFVGNLVSRKRPMLFVDSALKTLEKDQSIHFVIVGKDNEGYAEQITEAVERRGLSSNIHLLGYRSDVAKIMASLDLLVLTSTEHGEAFPRVPLEAMACGTPVVTTDTAGVSEAVADGETGIVLGTDPSTEEISNSIINIVRNNGRKKMFASQGVSVVKNRFSATITADKIEQIYRKELSE